MTWRCVYGEPFPEHADFATEAEAHAFALRVSRETGGEVAVIEIGGALDFLARCRQLGERGLASGLVAQLRQAGEDVILRAFERMSDEEIRSVSEKYAEFREGDGQGGVKTGAGVAHGGSARSPEGGLPGGGGSGAHRGAQRRRGKRVSETTKTQAFVRVMRNPHRTADRPWLVFCDICSQGLWFAFHPLGWARTWQTAQDYATKHAAEHRDAACPCCGHMKPIKGEAK